MLKSSIYCTSILTSILIFSSCLTSDDEKPADELITFEDTEPATLDSIDGEDSAGSDMKDMSLTSTSETEAPDGKKEVEDYSITENYKSFDPGGILVHFEFDESELNGKTIAALEKIVAGLKKIQLQGLLFEAMLIFKDHRLIMSLLVKNERIISETS